VAKYKHHEDAETRLDDPRQTVLTRYRNFESISLRQAVRDFRVLWRKIENSAHVFQITIHLENSPEEEKAWEEQARQRRLAMGIPVVSKDDAQAIELAAPATRV
jgi:hypothetical protein